MEIIREIEDFKSLDKRRKRFYVYKFVFVWFNLRMFIFVNIYFIKMLYVIKGD